MEPIRQFSRTSNHDFARCFIQYFSDAKLAIRDGFAPPPPPPSTVSAKMQTYSFPHKTRIPDATVHEVVGDRSLHDTYLGTVLSREFIMKEPVWRPHSKHEARLPVSFLHHAKKVGWNVDHLSWARAMDVYASLHKPDLAEQAFRLMIHQNITPCGMVVAALMNAYALVGNLKAVRCAWRYAVANGIKLDHHVYRSLVYGFLRCGLKERAWDVVRYIIARGIYLDRRLASAYLQACGSVDELRKVVTVFRLCSKGPFGQRHYAASLEGITLHAVADSVSVEEYIADVKEVLEEWTQCEDSAVQVLRELKTWRSGLKIASRDVHLFDALLALCKEWTAFTTDNIFISVMNVATHKCIPNAVKALALIPTPKASAYAALLSAYTIKKDYDNVRELWLEMMSRDVVPNALCFALHIQACGDRAGSSDDAFSRTAEALFVQALETCKDDLYLWAMQMRVFYLVADAAKARTLDRLRKTLSLPKGKLYASYFRSVSPGPTPFASQKWTALENEVEVNIDPADWDKQGNPPKNEESPEEEQETRKQRIWALQKGGTL